MISEVEVELVDRMQQEQGPVQEQKELMISEVEVEQEQEQE